MRLRPQARFEANRRKAALRPRWVQDIPPAGLLRAKSLAPLGCATHGTAVPIFGTVNGTFLLHKRKVGLRERPSHRDAVKTPNNRAEAVTVFSVACGAVLSTDGKYPKVAGALSMCPRPLTTTCLGGLRSPWPGRAYPLRTGDEGV